MAVNAADKSQPLNVKTGLWQITATNTTSGLPPIPANMQARIDKMTPEQRASWETAMKSRFGATPRTTTHKQCVTNEDLDKDPFSGRDDKCNWTVVTSTRSEREMHGSSCEVGESEGMKTDIDMKLQVVDSENVKASLEGTATGNGHTVNINGAYTGKWIGPACGTVK
jgi:hypothetical protein